MPPQAYSVRLPIKLSCPGSRRRCKEVELRMRSIAWRASVSWRRSIYLHSHRVFKYPVCVWESPSIRLYILQWLVCVCTFVCTFVCVCVCVRAWHTFLHVSVCVLVCTCVCVCVVVGVWGRPVWVMSSTAVCGGRLWLPGYARRQTVPLSWQLYTPAVCGY